MLASLTCSAVGGVGLCCAPIDRLRPSNDNAKQKENTMFLVKRFSFPSRRPRGIEAHDMIFHVVRQPKGISRRPKLAIVTVNGCFCIFVPGQTATCARVPAGSITQRGFKREKWVR